MISRADRTAIASYYEPPEYHEAPFHIETFDSLRYQETVDRQPIRSNENEHVSFRKEVERLERLRDSSTDWEPIVVRLLHGDQEIERKTIECLLPQLPR